MEGKGSAATRRRNSLDDSNNGEENRGRAEQSQGPRDEAVYCTARHRSAGAVGHGVNGEDEVEMRWDSRESGESGSRRATGEERNWWEMDRWTDGQRRGGDARARGQLFTTGMFHTAYASTLHLYSLPLHSLREPFFWSSALPRLFRRRAGTLDGYTATRHSPGHCRDTLSMLSRHHRHFLCCSSVYESRPSACCRPMADARVDDSEAARPWPHQGLRRLAVCGPNHASRHSSRLTSCFFSTVEENQFSVHMGTAAWNHRDQTVSRRQPIASSCPGQGKT